ncbi:hypothetical protein EDD17DRAFT_174880 [Pisolithus thermaeus]|nr:hypothetical protein EV401DRAFT_1498813 [Pisolithus croceorrhizus]KAI6165625.1 hypothetical protein EDD17DRAFT_174880 [Pisolithus thermaeus]
MPQLSHAVYKFVNRQSGTAMDVVRNSVVGMSPSYFKTQQWEVIPSGDGYMIRNVETQKYLSFQTLSPASSVVTTTYPTTWDINRVYIPYESAVFYEIRWPHSSYVLDLKGGDSVPNTRIQIIDQSLESHSAYDRCRLWKVMLYRSISTTSSHHEAATTSVTTQPHRLAQSQTLNTRPQQSERGNSPWNAAGNEHGNTNMYDHTGPPPLTSVRSPDMAPRGIPPRSKEPTTGTSTMMGAAHGQMPIPALQINGAPPVSHGPHVGDPRGVAFANPVGTHSSWLGTQDVGGQTMNRNEDGGHAADVERRGGGGIKRLFRG